ncbi:MAG TPA: hypothetical protein VEY30_04190, partial [Myxococcaceae bacterium]|nr:hypothetical protein [Myxococcaceae bacterium]
MRTAPLSPLAPRSPYPAREERPETAAIRTVRPEEPAGFPAADAFDLSVGAPATVPEASPLGRPKTEREVLEALDGLLSHPEVFRACEVLTEASPGRAPAVQIAEGELSAVSDRDEGAYAVTFRWAGPRTLEVIHDRPFGGSTEPRRRTLGGKGEGFEVIERWNVPFAGRLADGTLVEARYPRRANLYSRRIFGKTLTGEDYRQLVGARPGAYIRISAQHESEDRLEVRVVSDGQTWLFSRGTEGQGPRVELVGWTRREVDGPGAETRALARALPALDAHGVKEIVTRVGMQSEKLLGNKDWSRVGFRRESPSRGELDAWHDAGGMRELTFNLGPGSASRARLERLRRSAEQNLDLPRTSAARATDEGLPTTGADFVPPTPSVSGRPTALPSRRVIEGLKAIHTFLGRRIPLSAYAQLAEGPAQGHVEVWATPDRMTIAVDGGTVPYITTVRSPRKGVLEVFRDVPSLLGTPTPGLGHEQPSLSRHRRVGPLKLEEHWYAATEDTLADGTRVLADH